MKTAWIFKISCKCLIQNPSKLWLSQTNQIKEITLGGYLKSLDRRYVGNCSQSAYIYAYICNPVGLSAYSV